MQDISRVFPPLKCIVLTAVMGFQIIKLRNTEGIFISNCYVMGGKNDIVQKDDILTFLSFVQSYFLDSEANYLLKAYRSAQFDIQKLNSMHILATVMTF